MPRPEISATVIIDRELESSRRPPRDRVPDFVAMAFASASGGLVSPDVVAAITACVAKRRSEPTV